MLEFFGWLIIFGLTSPIWMLYFSFLIAGIYAIFALEDLKLGAFLIISWVVLQLWVFLY